MAVHGAIYISRVWHPTKQPAIQRDRWVQKGEIISLWEAIDENHWYQWHIDNPHIVRLRILDVTLAQVEHFVSPYQVPEGDNPFGGKIVARRLWRLDIAAVKAAYEQRLGRPLRPRDEPIVLTKVQAVAIFKRFAEGGQCWNKAAGDIALNDPTRLNSPAL